MGDLSKILINLVASNSGGGLQNSLSLLDQFPQHQEFFRSAYVVCKKGGSIHQACKRIGIKYYTIKPGYLARIWFELIGGFFLAYKNNTRVIFTLFGNAPIVSPNIYKVSGIAFSNILQPEIPFWDFLPPLQQHLKATKDFLRIWSARRSDEIILETDYLADRARKGIFKDKILHVVKMEPSSLVLQSMEPSSVFIKKDYGRLLVLSGPHPNKRIEAMAPIMACLNKLRSDFGLPVAHLSVTINPEHPYSRKVLESFRREGVEKCLSLIGPVSQERVGELLRTVDGIVNIARLESFSNNWVEAWAAGIPLITTDSDWARASCGDAAIYVNPSNPQQSAELIFKSLASVEDAAKLIFAGRNILRELTQIKKIDAYYSVISSALARLDQCP